MTSLFTTDATSKICPDCGRLFTPACIHGAEGEIARLREALEKIRDHSPIPTSIYNIARAALGAP